MIKYPPNHSNNAPQAADNAKVNPFAHQPRTETDDCIDAFLAAKGPEFQARIDATDKDYFVRKWLAEVSRQDETFKQYEAAITRVLERPENREVLDTLRKAYAERQDGEVIGDQPAFRQAVSPSVPRMTP